MFVCCFGLESNSLFALGHRAESRPNRAVSIGGDSLRSLMLTVQSVSLTASGFLPVEPSVSTPYCHPLTLAGRLAKRSSTPRCRCLYGIENHEIKTFAALLVRLQARQLLLRSSREKDSRMQTKVRSRNTVESRTSFVPAEGCGIDSTGFSSERWMPVIEAPLVLGCCWWPLCLFWSLLLVGEESFLLRAEEKRNRSHGSCLRLGVSHGCSGVLLLSLFDRYAVTTTPICTLSYSFS